jgi:hypothetical protein
MFLDVISQVLNFIKYNFSTTEHPYWKAMAALEHLITGTMKILYQHSMLLKVTEGSRGFMNSQSDASWTPQTTIVQGNL